MKLRLETLEGRETPTGVIPPYEIPPIPPTDPPPSAPPPDPGTPPPSNPVPVPPGGDGLRVSTRLDRSGQDGRGDSRTGEPRYLGPPLEAPPRYWI